jgi:hypothetical protein
MSIRWRLALAALQLLLLSLASYIATGRPVSGEQWFFGGLLAIVVNPQLLEPFYPRPADVVANVVIFLFIFATGRWTSTAAGWRVFAYLFGGALLFAVVALIFGANRAHGRLTGVARFARGVSQLASARLIYSAVFVLSALELSPGLRSPFWELIGFWIAILGLGVPNWPALWRQARGASATVVMEGIIGPSIAVVSAPFLPEIGTRVAIAKRGFSTWGVVVGRIRRLGDVWGHVHVQSSQDCERMLGGGELTLTPSTEHGGMLVGSVDVGSTDRVLSCAATRTLEVGNVVAVPMSPGEQHIIYQIASSSVERLETKGGSQLVVRIRSNQLGIFDHTALRFRRHRWVPAPGAPVWTSEIVKVPSAISSPKNGLLLGHVIGTRIPIYIDLALASEGHMAILGMTKMGKSTLAERIARELAQTRRVTVLDLTGEYVSKKGFPPVDREVDWKSPGVSVFEPKPGEVPPKRAQEFLDYCVKQALAEYKNGDVVPRSVIIDEAHQFIPEPAGLGFNAPGRDSSYAIGLLMMQIRKYGISVVLISQRTAVVAKSALSQCENVIAFRNVDQTGLDYLEAIAGEEVRGLLPQLRQGEALAFGPAISSDGPVAIALPAPEDRPTAARAPTVSGEITST